MLCLRPPSNYQPLRSTKQKSKTRWGDAAGGRGWLLAVDPETGSARIVARQTEGFVPEVEGHEDLFPLAMALEREDGFLPGGDWVVASTPSRRAHDGEYRSYWVRWEDE